MKKILLSISLLLLNTFCFCTNKDEIIFKNQLNLTRRLYQKCLLLSEKIVFNICEKDLELEFSSILNNIPDMSNSIRAKIKIFGSLIYKLNQIDGLEKKAHSEIINNKTQALANLNTSLSSFLQNFGYLTKNNTLEQNKEIIDDLENLLTPCAYDIGDYENTMYDKKLVKKINKPTTFIKKQCLYNNSNELDELYKIVFAVPFIIKHYNPITDEPLFHDNAKTKKINDAFEDSTMLNNSLAEKLWFNKNTQNFRELVFEIYMNKNYIKDEAL